MKGNIMLMTGSAVVLLGAAGCESVATSPCSNADGALDNAAFVFVATPSSGQRVSSGFAVSGCSRTFESSVQWRLTGRDGSTIAAGHTTGGGVDGFGPYSFTVPFTVAERQIGHLEVFETDESDGEGFPPGQNIIPLVLQP
ncbi:MAG: hypothetical protein HKO57_05435 [Akkermansiaceae bacterium]|nr:hypothetical protein [Akkermansiaceae bacterium]